MSSVKKEAIALNVMDYKQMFDAEELEICLNAMYSANIQDDMLNLILKQTKSQCLQSKHQMAPQKLRRLSIFTKQCCK